MHAAALLHAAAAAAQKPHIISILQDDLGFHDTDIHGDNAAAMAWSANITALAQEGVVLTRHYAHWHCSPTRRSFLSGRLPIHHGEQLSGNDADDIDLRMTWISAKLKSAGYATHWFGKWHTGFRSIRHLPLANGFDTALGSLQTGGAYSGTKHSQRWQNAHPIFTDADMDDDNRPAACGSAYTGLYADDTHPEAPAGCEFDGPTCVEARRTAALGACSGTVLNDTKLPCGSAKTFLNSTSADECCAACTADTDCTHWVYNPADKKKPACHIKTGDSDCAQTETGGAAGVVRNGPPPAPPAPPAGSMKCVDEYSTDLWGGGAVRVLADHDPAKAPIYIHLCFQAVHTPYDAPPTSEGAPDVGTYHQMLWAADQYVGQITSLLQSKQMWDDTFIMYSADNGGVGSGNNYPLRGEKHSSWEGGMRTAAFVSGGLVPAAVRGSKSNVVAHVVDWYVTFCGLAGVDKTDGPATAPLPADPAHPGKDIYGNDSYPALDGSDLWPALTSPSGDPAAAHARLTLSKEVLIAGKWKLLVSQPHFKSQNLGWKDTSGNWQNKSGNGDDCETQDVAPKTSFLPVPSDSKRRPCLYDVEADPGERNNVAAANPDVVAELWAALNNSVLTLRDCNGWSGPVAGPGGSCSPAELLGPCDKSCADKHYNGLFPSHGKDDGHPICGVPGC